VTPACGEERDFDQWSRQTHIHFRLPKIPKGSLRAVENSRLMVAWLGRPRTAAFSRPAAVFYLSRRPREQTEIGGITRRWRMPCGGRVSRFQDLWSVAGPWPHPALSQLSKGPMSRRSLCPRPCSGRARFPVRGRYRSTIRLPDPLERVVRRTLRHLAVVFGAHQWQPWWVFTASPASDERRKRRFMPFRALLGLKNRLVAARDYGPLRNNQEDQFPGSCATC